MTKLQNYCTFDILLSTKALLLEWHSLFMVYYKKKLKKYYHKRMQLIQVKYHCRKYYFSKVCDTVNFKYSNAPNKCQIRTTNLTIPWLLIKLSSLIVETISDLNQ